MARDQQAKLEKVRQAVLPMRFLRNAEFYATKLGVPCFYVLKGPDPVAQERQRKVMETLVTLLDES